MRCIKFSVCDVQGASVEIRDDRGEAALDIGEAESGAPRADLRDVEYLLGPPDDRGGGLRALGMVCPRPGRRSRFWRSVRSQLREFKTKD